jgi:hypothetical protein
LNRFEELLKIERIKQLMMDMRTMKKLVMQVSKEGKSKCIWHSI